MGYDNLIVEEDGPVAVLTMHRPQQLNALSSALIKDISVALDVLDEEEEVRAIILTGGEKVFAAGADIKEFAASGPFDDSIQQRFFYRDRINRVRKPLI